MKEMNQIRIAKIATILQTIRGDNIINDQDGIAFVVARNINSLGTELFKILEDEVGDKQ